MNISKYKALLTAVDMGSFSAAAQKLGYTQSGLTHMMNALEDELGFSILQRGYFGIKLTPGGERIIPKIRQLVMCEETLYNEIELVKSYGDNVIRIGAYSSIASAWIPSIVERFNKEFPDVTVNIQTGTVAELYGGLDEGRFDICFGSKNTKYDFKWMPLSLDRFYAILPKGYPVSEREFPISGFNGTKFLMPGLGFDDDISAVFSDNNVKPFVTPTYVDDPAIISMVEHGLGISMLSELILSGRHDDVMLLPIVPEVSRTLALCIKQDKVLTMPLKRLISITKDFVREAEDRFLVNLNKN
ncbi:MAG: LysR family transcriptional regulator [Clostridia bacterium]|nr:LysR family transcriptional regulator [Clostridia bacterium]